MKRFVSTTSAVALAACLTTLCAASVTPVRAFAAEVKIDSRILSAAPFEFHADRGIFSTVPGASPDSRIIMPPKPLPHPDEMQISQTRLRTQTLV
jgi:hypothetical protein